MINPEKIKKFWDERGEKFGDVPTNEMANLEPSQELQALKIALEQEAVNRHIILNSDMDILDLGAGYGQWAFRFAQAARSVTAVEYSLPMMKAGIAEAKRKGVENINFVHCAAESFKPQKTYSLVFISGLFMYLNDTQASAVSEIAAKALCRGGRLFLRESVSLLADRYTIEEQYSKAAGANYSALYRKPDEFIKMFEEQGLQMLEDGNMFPDGSPLNKWKETRLKFYLFKK